MPVPNEELLPATRRALLRQLAAAQSTGRVPSLVGAVNRDGVPVWSAGIGEVDGAAPTADTQYRVGSLTKTFAAVLVLRLRDEGRLDLGDPLDRHLPGAPVGGVRIGELLAHTSGLPSEAPGPWWERTPGTLRPEIADAVGPALPNHPPGLRFHYSNPGYALLGALVAELRGADWAEVLQREILDPLGMTRTSVLPTAPHARGWAVHPWADVLLPEPTEDVGVLRAAGQLWSTTTDLSRFVAFLTNGHDGVLCRETVTEMRTAAAPPSGPDAGYGLGLQLWRTNGRSLFGHTGSMPGFLCTLWISAEEGLAGIALANATSGVPIGALAADLVRTVAEHEPPIPEAWTPLPEVDPELLALTGPWYRGPVGFVMRLGADRAVELAPLGRPGPAVRFRAGTDGTWTGLDGYYTDETLRVVRAADGAVSHLDLGSFVLTREPYGAAGIQPGDVDPEGWRAGPVT